MDHTHSASKRGYGRSTAIPSVSDVDLLYELPASLYERFDKYQGNGQSALLAHVRSSIQNTYGRAAYTHKTHQKMADHYIARYKRIKVAEIVLSAATSSSLLIAIFGDKPIGTITGAVLSAILLGFTLYFKEAALGEQGQLHTEVGAKLWGAREALLSLLVDLQDGRPVEEVRQERDRLNATLEEIYKAAPRTNAKAYAAAQCALKEAEELFFTDEELNKMLPKQLRTASRHKP